MEIGIAARGSGEIRKLGRGGIIYSQQLSELNCRIVGGPQRLLRRRVGSEDANANSVSDGWNASTWNSTEGGSHGQSKDSGNCPHNLGLERTPEEYIRIRLHNYERFGAVAWFA